MESRRAFLRFAGAGIATSSLSGGVSSRASADDPTPSIAFEAQESDGRTVVVARAATDVEAFVKVEDADGGVVLDSPANRLDLAAGDVETDARLRLDERITESQKLTVVLQESNGGPLARDSAVVTVTGEPGERIGGFGPTLIEADPDAGFNYPYFLYAPSRYTDADARPVLVEPNNTGTATDEFERHLTEAERLSNGGTGRRLADALAAPFLVPVFPRPESDPVDGDHYVHQLDDTTMGIDDGPLERVDLQLVEMVADARRRLAERGYPVAERVMLNGFSASGNFVNRFAAFHPDLVASVTAGGINGMAILPVEEAKGHALDYHVGVADLQSLTGEPFDLDAFREVDQFLYMGELDRNDTIPFSDAWTDDDLRQVALDVYGEDMQDDRLPYSRMIYDEVGADAVFRIYEGAGHTPRPAFDDLVEFHRRSLAGDDVESIRADLGGNVPHPRAYIEYAPSDPAVGEQVAFDATRSAVADGEIVAYEWAFGDGTTATGDLATHTFDARGGHNVRLTTTDDRGRTYEAVERLVVGETRAAGSDAAGGGAGTPDAAPATLNAWAGENSCAVLGVGGAVAGLGSLVYVLEDRFGDGE